MGLDIYLYNGDLNLHFCDSPDDPKDEHGWRKRGNWDEKPERAQAKSQRHPKHYCERTYLRSSYNSAGFNSVVRDLIGMDWYDVFGEKISEGLAEPPREDDGGVAVQRLTTAEVHAELRNALDRARTLTTRLREVRNPLRVMTESPELIGHIADVDAAGAIAITNEEIARGTEGGYSNRAGAFFHGRPLEVIAVVRGVDVLKRPCLHLVYRGDLTHYVQAAEIAEEFIEYALTLDDPRIAWSG